MSDIRFSIDRDAMAAEIRAQVETAIAAGEYDTQLNQFMESEVVAAWVANSPEDDGDYKRSVEVKHQARNGKGAVGTSIGYAHMIEYGTNDTPEFAPREKAAASFNNGSTGDYGGRRAK